jgi:hypothetical protein
MCHISGRREVHKRFWWEKGKKPFAKPQPRLDDPFKMNLTEIKWRWNGMIGSG